MRASVCVGIGVDVGVVASSSSRDRCAGRRRRRCRSVGMMTMVRLKTQRKAVNADADDGEAMDVEAFARAVSGGGTPEDDEELDAFLARCIPEGSLSGLVVVARETCAPSTLKAPASKEEAREARTRRGVAATCFNAIISALVRVGRADEAADALKAMRECGVKPDVVSYSLAAAGLMRAGNQRADDVLKEAEVELKRGTRANRKKKKKTKIDPLLRDVRILFDEADVCALLKPANCLTHPAETSGGSATFTLVDAAMDIFDGELSDLNGADKRGVVSRLDKPTSGIVVLAKNNRAHAELLAQFFQRDVEKTYLALVDGKMESDDGIIDERLEGRTAVSKWRLVERFEVEGSRFSLVEVRPKSGRFHQIRQHMAAIGHPLTGDPMYRKGRGARYPSCVVEALTKGKPGTIFWLHCAELKLRVNGAERVVQAPPPADFDAILARLRES